MSKTVTINQDKLLMLKETVASDSNITSHNSYCSELTEAAPEVDEYEIGDEGNNPPVGGNFYHVNESTSFDSSEVGVVNYSWDFDEEEYQEWLQEAEYENTQEALMEYINDNVEFELEYLDNETYHTCGCDYVDYNALEDMFGEKMQKEILTTCMSDGSGSFETVNLYSDDDVDINDRNSVNDMAMRLLRHGDYFKDCRGFILTNGVVVYTESEHNKICRIPNINNKFDFIRMGNIRVLPQSIDIGDRPTNEQRDVLRRAIASYADEELYLDIYQGKSSIGAHYIHPDWRYVMGEIDRFYSEGIKPQGNEYYESKNKNLLDGLNINESASFDSSEIGAVMDINAIAKKIQTKGNSSYILTNGEVITFRDHSEISKINGMTVGKFLNLGNIRIGNLGGIELIKKPTKEQIKPLKKHIIEFNGSLFLDIASYKEGRFYAEMICGAEYKNANPNRIINDILTYFDEGIKPQGNRFYESKKNKAQIIENKYNDRGNLSLIEPKNKNKLETIKENFDFEVDSSEIDLSSFKKKHELVPNIWKPDGKLDSRIRLKLLDIADDFWKYVNLTWVEPSGIILTGSICNFNWSQYSDIDLHLIVDFDEIDEKIEFVKDYLDSKKNEWNNEHKGLQIMGYQVELYVQNVGEMLESNGIYDLEENDWIKEPNPDDIKSIGLNKFSIKDKAAKIMTIIDDMYDALASTDDSHQIEQIGDDADYLWKKVKEMRKSSLEKHGESGSGNIVYKYIKRKFYLDKLWRLKNMCYDKTNSITESKSEKKKYTVYINDKKDETFSDMNWKRKPKIGKGFYCGGAFFKIKKVTDDSIYAIEESKFNNKEIIKEYLEKDYNLPLYKYFKWASTASSCEKARDLAYSCSYYIGEYIKKNYFRYSEFEDLLNDGEFDYEDESLVEMFLNMLEDNNLCDHFVSEMQDIVDYYELPSWCTMDFNRIVKNEWCIHFGSDSESIAKEGFTMGTQEIEHLAYTNAGAQKSSAGYDFAFLINDRSVDYNGYGDEAVIFRTSGVEIYHYGDNQNQVVFWGPNVKSFIPIHQDNGDWVVYGQNGQVLVRCGRPSEIALWATENLPQYRKQIMTGKNGYTPKQWVYDKEQGKSKPIPYPIYRNESVKKYITLLKENFINEEFALDGNTEHNPYKKRWETERKVLKDFICNNGVLMQSKEDNKQGKLYKCFTDTWLSNLIGYNYCLCVQYDEIKMKPKSVVYIRALDKFTPNIRRNVTFDNRGFDNLRNTYDDVRNY